MRILVVLLGISSLSLANAHADTNRVDLPKDVSAASQTNFVATSQTNFVRTMQFQTTKLQTTNAFERLQGSVSYNGILPQIKRADNPWQLINPAAPMEYGDGYQNVARNPAGRADGIALFSINFGSGEPKVKP